jgi:hypothetical protein
MPIKVDRMHFRLLLLKTINPTQNTGINAQRIGAKIDPAESNSILSIECHGAENLLD